jgi:acetoin utilization protein AcuB
MSEIRHFMTESHHAVGHDQTLRFAHERMQQFGIQHVPVLDGGVLVGVLSDRDIALIGAVSPAKLDTITVEEAMVSEPYAVPANEELTRVAAHMALHKQRAAVVMDHNKVIGVFTVSDALALLSRLLEQGELASAVDRLARNAGATKKSG